jgi:hypothetical protein
MNTFQRRIRIWILMADDGFYLRPKPEVDRRPAGVDKVAARRHAVPRKPSSLSKGRRRKRERHLKNPTLSEGRKSKERKKKRKNEIKKE